MNKHLIYVCHWTVYLIVYWMDVNVMEAAAVVEVCSYNFLSTTHPELLHGTACVV